MIDPDLIEKCEIFDGDSLNIMKNIKSNSVDCINAALYNRKRWTDTMMERYFESLKRILKDTGSILIAELLPDLSFDMYDNESAIIAQQNVGLILQHDSVYTHYTKSDKFFREYNSPKIPIYEKNNGKSSQRMVNGTMETFGPQIPGLHMDLAASTYTPPGGILFDPMCGRGSELIAALQRNKRAIGIDSDPDSTKYARKRIAKYLEYGCVP